MKLLYIGILKDFFVLYYIKFTKLVKLGIFGLLKIFRGLYYIRVLKLVKLACIGISEDFRVLQAKIHEVRETFLHWYFERFLCVILHKLTKFVKLANFNILEYFYVLHCIKYTKFVKPGKYCLFENVHMLYNVKVTKFVKLAHIVFWKIFVCYTT